MIPALLAAAIATLPTDAIAPPLDVAIRQEQIETRSDGRTRRVFKLARSLRFAAEPGGLRVAVTTLSADTEGTDARERENYRAANRGLVDRAMIVHLDPTGRVTAIDELDAIWAAWVDGLAAAQGDTANAAARAAMARLGALSVQQRIEMLGAIVAACIASPAERTVSAERAVSAASAPPFGEILLRGTATSTAVGGRVINRLAATGASADGSIRISLTVTRTVDPTTGLLTASSRRTTTSSPRGTMAVENTQTLTW